MTITQIEIEAAQNEWAHGIVEIGSTFTAGGNYRQRAKQHLESLYAFEEHEVLFKPTKCEQIQFRPSFAAALSYFVGGNPNYPEDKGFAISPFVAVRFENSNLLTLDSVGLAMGNYFFTSPDGSDTKVEYSFGYRKVGDRLKIVLHHSSLPYQAP